MKSNLLSLFWDLFVKSIEIDYFRFVSVTDLYVPTANGVSENIFITQSYDATSHFETVTDDLKDVYRRVTGNPLDLTKPKARPAEEQ